MNQRIKEQIDRLQIDKEAAPYHGDRFPTWWWVIALSVAVLMIYFLTPVVTTLLTTAGTTSISKTNTARPEYTDQQTGVTVASSHNQYTTGNLSNSQSDKNSDNHSDNSMPLKTGASTEAFIVSGYVVAPKEATVSARVSGFVHQVLVKEGDTVTEGQLLAKIDSEDAELSYAMAEAELEIARISLSQANENYQEEQRILNRILALDARKLATQSEITQLKTRVYRAKAQLNEAEVTVNMRKIAAEQSKSYLNKFDVLAPFAGSVISVNSQAGEMISPEYTGNFAPAGVCTIIDMNSMEVEAEVNELYLKNIYPGQKVVIEVESYQRHPIAGTVAAIVRAVDKATGAVKVRIKLADIPDFLFPNMRVKARFNASVNINASANINA